MLQNKNYQSHAGQNDNLEFNCMSSVEQVQIVLEQFFHYQTTFQWDRAKKFLEFERDSFRNVFQNQASNNTILVQMIQCLIQLLQADKAYLTLQFFSTKVFQRKDS